MKPVTLTLTLLFAALAASGCKAGSRDAADAVATVNGDPISSAQLTQELALHSKKDPSFKITPESVREQVDVLVTRRILIQAAQERKLTEDERFTQTIRTFWEQTLVKLLMDRLYEDFDRNLFVTDQEIADYYAKLGRKVTFQIAESADRAALEAVSQKAAQGDFSGLETLGPVRYDDVRSTRLDEMFLLEPGESRIVEDGGRFGYVRVAAAEADAPPPLEQIKDKIRARVKQRKQMRAFEEWLEARRKKADVRYELESAEAAS